MPIIPFLLLWGAIGMVWIINNANKPNWLWVTVIMLTTSGLIVNHANTLIDGGKRWLTTNSDTV